MLMSKENPIFIIVIILIKKFLNFPMGFYKGEKDEKSFQNRFRN